MLLSAWAASLLWLCHLKPIVSLVYSCCLHSIPTTVLGNCSMLLAHPVFWGLHSTWDFNFTSYLSWLLSYLIFLIPSTLELSYFHKQDHVVDSHMLLNMWDSSLRCRLDFLWIKVSACGAWRNTYQKSSSQWFLSHINYISFFHPSWQASALPGIKCTVRYCDLAETMPVSWCNIVSWFCKMLLIEKIGRWYVESFLCFVYNCLWIHNPHQKQL